MTERARAWWTDLSATQKTLAAILGVAISAFGMGAGVAAAMANVAGIPASVERHEVQLRELVGIPAAVDSLRSRAREQGRALNYLACREWRAEKGLDLEYCEPYLRPEEFLGERVSP